MNLDLIKKIADAVLYEGYILYPYRASAVKNRQRFNWGVLAPESYSAAQRGTENWRMQTEVLIVGDKDTEVDLRVRFLHLREREVHQVDEATLELNPVEVLEINGKIFQTWQEAVEREVSLSVPFAVADDANLFSFSFPDSREIESLCDENKRIAGAVIRTQESIEGEIEVRTTKCGTRNGRSIFKLTVRVLNTTPFENAETENRDEALAHSFVSAHTILIVKRGEFVSLLEPPEEFAEAARSCENTATYPVLVGEEGARDSMLSSPIILYDYPQIAAESPGDLFDGGEIDEILTLRILTMTDEEKREMCATDESARKILERSENLSPEQFMKMHGVLRQPRAFENEDFFENDLEKQTGAVSR